MTPEKILAELLQIPSSTRQFVVLSYYLVTNRHLIDNPEFTSKVLELIADMSDSCVGKEHSEIQGVVIACSLFTRICNNREIHSAIINMFNRLNLSTRDISDLKPNRTNGKEA